MPLQRGHPHMHVPHLCRLRIRLELLLRRAHLPKTQEAATGRSVLRARGNGGKGETWELLNLLPNRHASGYLTMIQPAVHLLPTSQPPLFFPLLTSRWWMARSANSQAMACRIEGGSSSKLPPTPPAAPPPPPPACKLLLCTLPPGAPSAPTAPAAAAARGSGRKRRSTPWLPPLATSAKSRR